MVDPFTVSAILFVFSTGMSSSALSAGLKAFLSDRKKKKTDAVFFKKLDGLLKEKEEKDDPYFGAFIENKESIFGEIINDANILSITDPQTLVSEMVKATYSFCDEIKEDTKFSKELKSVFEKAVNETLKEFRIAAKKDDDYHKIITFELLETLIKRTEPYRAYGIFSKEDEPDFLSALNFNPDLLDGYEERGETKGYDPSGKKTLILGIPGMGKTTTMAKLIERCEYDTGVLIGRDFHDESDVTSLIHEIKERVTGKDGKVLIVWDDLQYLSKQEQFINLVLKFSSTFDNRLTVISAARVPEFFELKTKTHSFWNEFEKKELTEFPRETAINIAAFAAKHFDVKVTKEAINKLVEKSQEGTPLYIVSAFSLSSGGELTKDNIEHFPEDILALWKLYYEDLSTNEKVIINTLRLLRISYLPPVERVVEKVSKDVFERNEPFEPLVSSLNRKHWIRIKSGLILIHDIPLESTGITLNNLKDRYFKRLSASILQSDFGRDLDTLMNNNYAISLQGLGRFEEAETHYQKALEINPNNAGSHNNYAILLQGLERFEEAETHYREALEINPKYAEAHNNYALLQGLERVDEAESHYKKALEINPKNAGTHYNYANLLQGLERFEEAETHYREALEINPKDAGAHNNYAILLKGLERFEEAETHHKKALEINPEYVDAHNNYAILLKGLKRFDDAETHYQKALKINPNNAEAHYNYAILLEGLRRVEEAETHYKEALKINPKYAEAHYNYAVLLKGLKRVEEAEAHYKEALKINPQHADAHNNYAILLEGLKRFKKAETHYQKALEINPKDAKALVNLGALYLTGEKRFVPEKATTCLINAFLLKEQLPEKGIETLFQIIARLEEILSMNVDSDESADSIRAFDSILLGRICLVTWRLDHAYIWFNRFKKFQKHLPDGREEAEKGQESIITFAKKAIADKNTPPPIKSHAFMFAGVIQMTDGNPQEAIKLYQKSLKLAKKGNPEVHIEIADRILGHVSNSKSKSSYGSFSLELCSEIDKLSVSADIKDRFREYKKTFEGD